MDEKIIFYIILGIIYFIYNAVKKKKPDNEPGPDRPQSRPQTNKPQPVSFEDLLREITEGKEPQKFPESPVNQKTEYRQPLPKPKPAYVDYDDDLEDEEKSLEKTSFDDDRSNKAYEEAKKMAFNRPSLEETLKLDQVNTTFGRFKVFEKKEDSGVLFEYVKDLRDPKGFKKALILSEVLNRRHF